MNLYKEKCFHGKVLAIKSIQPFSELTGISVTIEATGSMLLTLSSSLNQSTGLDASKILVDSAIFDSSTRLLQFDLKTLQSGSGRLERIQKNSVKVLSRPEYSCEFVAIVDSSFSVTQLSEILNCPVTLDNSLRPKLTKKPLKTLSWPVKDEFDLKDQNELLELFDWIGFALNPELKGFTDDTDYFITDTCSFLCLEGVLLPPIFIYSLLSRLSASSSRLVASLKCCKGIPPSFDLNNNRLKHFNEKKFDPTVCTADQGALAIFQSPLQSITFRLNITS